MTLTDQKTLALFQTSCQYKDLHSWSNHIDCFVEVHLEHQVKQLSVWAVTLLLHSQNPPG